MQHYVYIILMHTGTLPGWLVRQMTGFPYGHVGISIDRECDRIYSFGRRSLRNFLNGGFVVEQKNGPFFTKFHQTVCRIDALPVSAAQYGCILDQLKQMEQNHAIYHYDFAGAACNIFRIPVSFRNRYVCSSFVAKVLQEAGVAGLPAKVSLTRPQDFLSLPQTRKLYVGPYLSYRAEPEGQE